MEAIDEYILRSLPKGISTRDTTAALERIGRVTVTENTLLSDGRTRLVIAVDFCLNPFNYVELYVVYSSVGKLESVRINNDSP